MIYDLVVRAEDARIYAEMAKRWTVPPGGEEDDATAIGNLARAYLECEAQLAAMTTERDEARKLYEGTLTSWAVRDALVGDIEVWRGAQTELNRRYQEALVQLTASEAAREKLQNALVKIARPGDFTLQAEIARDCLETLAEERKEPPCPPSS